nr:MAG TPA: hypothetical protein [Caudoviricetes sp.]
MRALKSFSLLRQLRLTRPTIKIRQLRWPSCVFLNLLLGLTLTACAPASPVLKKEPRALPIETQFDVLSWEQSVDDYCKRFEDLLNTVEKRYSSK